MNEVEVALPSGITYPVIIGNGALDHAAGCPWTMPDAMFKSIGLNSFLVRIELAIANWSLLNCIRTGFFF